MREVSHKSCRRITDVTVQPSVSCYRHQAIQNRFAMGLMLFNYYVFLRTLQHSAKSWAELLPSKCQNMHANALHHL